MGHPIFHDVPSRDMTKAQERQAELDAQIEAFLAKGGEIKAYDTLRRPVKPGEWGKFSIRPRPPAPVAVPKAQPNPEPEQPVEVIVSAVPQAEEFQEEPAPVIAEVIATIPVPRSISASTGDALKQLRKDAAAIKRRLDALGNKVART